jgi:N-acetylmuramoyl-L-alanine amidase
MQLIKKHSSTFQYFILLMFFCLTLPVNAQDLKFTVVLDAGHGGHDPGATGSMSREKDINLSVALDIGSLIEQNFKDVKVIYTRKTDKYLTLQERADVVNDHHADLFICVHTNASPSPLAYGAETFTLGLAKSKANLDVAMRENSVILLEEDYKTKYKGFDPNSVDSYIMFEFMQDKYIDRSIDFSSIIQKQFVSFCRRTDRGVRQAGFWVLHRSACPSVLVELGFISNPAEERYLSSETGQKEMAKAVFNAFVDYKHTHDRKSGRLTTNFTPGVQKIKPEEPKQSPVVSAVVDSDSKPMVTSVKKTTSDTVKKTAQPNLPVAVTPEKVIQPKSGSLTPTEKVVPTKSIPVVSTVTEFKSDQIPVFKVQLFASKKAVKLNSSDFKGLTQIGCFIENGLNKYTVGAETDYQKIETIRKNAAAKFPEAFIIAFIGDKKISAKEALKQIK